MKKNRSFRTGLSVFVLCCVAAVQLLVDAAPAYEAQHDMEMCRPTGFRGFMIPNHVDNPPCLAGPGDCSSNIHFLGPTSQERSLSMPNSVRTGQRILLNHMGLKSIRSVIVLENSTVVVTDAVGGRVISFDLADIDAKNLGKEFSWRELGFGDLNPGYVTKVPNNRFVQVATGMESGLPQQVEWLGSDLSRKRILGFAQQQQVEDTVMALYDWIVAGDQIFSYGALNRLTPKSTLPTNRYDPFKMGFIVVDLEPSEAKEGEGLKGELVEELSDFGYYTLGFPYISSIGNDIYFVKMQDQPSIYIYNVYRRDHPKKLGVLPGNSAALRQIDVNVSTHELFAAIENLEMPVGLYADAEQRTLYLLRRSPRADGMTDWTMTKLRPELENMEIRDLGTVILPTNAKHLEVLFTQDSVLVFEKSSVRPGREQDVEALLVLPKVRVSKPRFPVSMAY